MNKGLIIIGLATVIIAVFFLLYENDNNDKELIPAAKQQMVKGNKGDVFNKPFNLALNHYFSLRDALAAWDTSATDLNAGQLSSAINKIPFSTLQINSDSVQKAINLSQGISAEANGLVADKSIDEKRRSFYILSEKMYALINTVQYDQQVIYHQHCPMAFNDEGASWFSNSSEIKNPYLGDKHPKYHASMLTCGSIEDSIDYVNN